MTSDPINAPVDLQIDGIKVKGTITFSTKFESTTNFMGGPPNKQISSRFLSSYDSAKEKIFETQISYL